MVVVVVVVVTIKGKGKVLTENHAMKTYWGRGTIAPRNLDLGTRWK